MSLVELQKKALLAKLNQHQASFRHLIADETSFPVIEKLLKDEVLNYVYTFYQIDDENRSSNRDQAIYVLDPISPYAIDCLLGDFSSGRRYHSAVVCFLPGLTKTTYAKLRANKYLMEATGGKFDKIEFLSLDPLENRVYVTNSHFSVPVLYNGGLHGQDLHEFQIDKAVESMLSLCILTNEYPIVRHYNSPVSHKIATLFQQSLDEYYRRNPELSPVGSKTVFFVADRTMDLFGPFCHYKYYRSQVFDLMDHEVRKARGEYTYIYDYEIQTGAGMETKHLVFDDADPVFSELKNLPIEEYTKTIIEKVGELKATEAKLSNLKYTSDLTHAALNQSDFMFIKQLVTGHFELIRKIDETFRNEDLLECIVFENKCATDVNGNKELFEPLTDDLIALLANPRIDMGNKIRLMIVYAYYRGGIVESDLRKLCQFGLPDKKKVDSILTLFGNFEKLGFRLLKPNLSTKPCRKPSYFEARDTMELTERYVPSLTNIVTRLGLGKLPEVYNESYSSTAGKDDDTPKDFPYVKGAPIDDDDEAEQQRFNAPVRNMPRWKSAKQTTNDLKKEKILLFFAGGLTQSELSTVMSLEKKLNKNIFVGTDEIYSTWDLIGDIRLIDDNRKNFEFPLDRKFKKRSVPSFILEKSAPAAPKPSVSAGASASASSKSSTSKSQSLSGARSSSSPASANPRVPSAASSTDSSKEKRKRDKLLKRFKGFGI